MEVAFLKDNFLPNEFDRWLLKLNHSPIQPFLVHACRFARNRILRTPFERERTHARANERCWRDRRETIHDSG